VLISVHIPKAAGTSFGRQLERHFGPRLLLDYADRPLAPGHRLRRLAGALRARAQLTDVDCVHGHFCADKYAWLGARARWIVWLRDPLQRLASHYHYWQRVPDLRNPDCRALLQRRLSLEQFAALPRMRNVATRFLAGRPLEQFFFIGLVEDMAESQRRLHQLTAIAAPDEAVNVNAEAPDGHVLAAAVQRRLAALNQHDCRLYDQARALFERARP